jgi:hypothetical protein
VGSIRPSPTDALLFFAVFSRSAELLDLAKDRLTREFGPLILASPRVPFTDTEYYRRSMGPDLIKEWYAVDRIIDQSSLASIKIATQSLETSIGAELPMDVSRPINIDPGMIDLGKVMLASTKNHAHRIYVGNGIFVEVTLYLCEGSWAGWPWTYPDYRRPEVHAFFTSAREEYRTRRPERPPGSRW